MAQPGGLSLPAHTPSTTTRELLMRLGLGGVLCGGLSESADAPGGLLARMQR